MTLKQWPRLGVGLAAVLVVVPASAAHAALPGIDIITDPIGAATGFAWDKIEAGITRWILAAAGKVIEELAGFLGKAAEPDPSAVWFAGADSPYASVRLIGAGLLGLFALAGIIQGLLAGDAGWMLKRIGLTLPLAVLTIVGTVELTSRAIRLTDALAAGVLGPAGGQSAAFLGGFGRAITHASGGFAAVTIAVVAIIAGLAMWIELIVRAALVYLLVALSPLVFAAMVWPAARGAARRLVELLVAVVVAKLAIAIALAVGIAALAGAGEAAGPGAGVGDQAAMGLGTLLVGATVLLLGAFAPFVVLRLVPVAEAAIVAQGISRSPLRGAHTAGAAAVTATTLTRLTAPAAGATAVPLGVAATASRLSAPGPMAGSSAPPTPPSSTGADR